MSRKRRSCLLILVSLVVFVSCGLQALEPSMFASDVSAHVATRWFELQLKLIMETPGFTPPVASRALGYSGVALYEAVLGGMPDHNSLVGQLNDLTYLPQPEVGQRYDWAAVANSALATITRSLYLTVSPENWAAIDALEQEFAEQCRVEAGADVCSRSGRLRTGRRACDLRMVKVGRCVLGEFWVFPEAVRLTQRTGTVGAYAPELSCAPPALLGSESPARSVFRRRLRAPSADSVL